MLRNTLRTLMSKPSTTSAACPRLTRVRELLTSHNLDAFVVPSEDEHQCEYVPESCKRRAWLSNFDGSAGQALVTRDHALLWTDGRYHNQAAQQLSPQWTLMKAGLPGVATLHEWVAAHLGAGAKLGLDAKVVSVDKFARWKPALDACQVQLVCVDENPVDVAWEEEGTRPAPVKSQVFVHEERFTGRSVREKIDEVRQCLATAKRAAGATGVDALVVAALDQVAWLFNLRAADVPYNPVFIAYAVVTESECMLYVDAEQVGEEVRVHLEANDVVVKPYADVFPELTELCKREDINHVWLEGSSCSLALRQCLGEVAKPHVAQSPITKIKGVKNETELDGMRECHIRDAVAVCQYLRWLEESVAAGDELDEVSAADYLESRRAAQEHFKGLSFETISSSGPNGAVIHYAPTRGSCRAVNADEMYLCDSGGQYLDGTTDITRTVHFGEPTQHERECFTRVLQGHIALASAVFPPRTPGPKLDVLARQPLWRAGLDYRHGTGHGVGHFNGVHEGPHGISSSMHNSSIMQTPLVPGMVVTNEPGYYEDGNFGIRIESVMIVKNAETQHRFGEQQFYEFETIALVPLQRKLMVLSDMTEAEKRWIDDFHAKCLDKVGPRLEAAGDLDTLAWLKRETAPLPRE